MIGRPSSLCQLATDFTGTLPSGGAMVERKWDGWRAIYLPDHTGRKRLFTRNGMAIEGVEHILYQLARMEKAAGVPTVFDGEFVVGDSLAMTKAWCERGWKGGGTAGMLHVFDCLPYAQWERGGSSKPLIERKADLRECAGIAGADSWEWRPRSYGADEGAPAVRVVEDGWAFDAQDVLTEAQRVWSAGGEGVMAKNAEAPYCRNRNGSWLKVKHENAHRWMRQAA